MPFTEAIGALRRRLALTDAEWQSIWAMAGYSVKPVADGVEASVVRDLLKAAADTLEAGGTLADFRASYDRIVRESGWTYKGDSGWHSRLVYRMHVGTAYGAGRWEQAQRLEAARPGSIYIRYVTAGDHRVRDTHALWQGIVLPLAHPFWRTHWPPNGFNCRCHVMIVTARDLVRYGWTVTRDDDERLRVPPDDGFSGNPGIASLAAPETPVLAPDDELAIERLVDDAEALDPRASVHVAVLPPATVRMLSATDARLNLSAGTVRSHRHHTEVDAAGYIANARLLVLRGTIIADPKSPWHFRVTATIGGKTWLAVIKRDRFGRLWLQSLHRAKPAQVRRYRADPILREGLGE